VKTKLAIVFVCAVVCAAAQTFSGGIRAGLPLTDFISTVNGVSSTVTNRYIVGPTGELHLPFGLGIQLDALYRHFNYQNVIGSGASAVVNVNTAGAWEFPLLLKYRFKGKLARPFVTGGVAWDRITGLTSTIQRSVSSGTLANPSGQQNSTTVGAVFGLGLDVHFVIHIQPEVRFTRWTSQHFNIENVLNSNQSQAEFLVGFTF
jgi:hypothetical protein